jgi:hypothetical protein
MRPAVKRRLVTLAAAASLVLCIGSVALFVTFGALPAVRGQEKAAIAKAHLEYGPITLAANCVGNFARGRSWYLSVNSAGQAELTISGRDPIQFHVPQDQWKAFRSALSEQRFFELAEEYGEVVPDSSSQALTVIAGDVTKTVRVRFLMNWVQGDRAKLVEPARAVRLLMAVRGWIPDAEAADLRPYDQRVLDAAPK